MYYDLKTEKIITEDESKGTKFLYNNIFGRLILWILTRPFISKLVSIYMNSRLSKIKINRFIHKNRISMGDYEDKNYKSFNDFFMRKIKKGKRNIEKGLISICDAKLSVYEISDDLTLDIKNSKYTIEELTKEDITSHNYKYALVFRLCVDDYHHYIFPDEGKVVSNKKIKGILHTVRPIAFKRHKVFTENAREVTFLECKNLKDVCYIEVGAMMIGKIVNEKVLKFKKGDEKGHFEFGGSTIIMLVGSNIKVNDIFINNTRKGIETIVKMGNKLD